MDEVLGDVYVACVTLLLTNKTYDVQQQSEREATSLLDTGTYRQQVRESRGFYTRLVQVAC